MKQVILTITLLLTSMAMSATEVQDSDSVATTEKPRKLSLIRRIVRGFDRLDDDYIEPQHYVFTVMLQSTWNYDIYTIRDANGHSLTFAPDVQVKTGPYFGWKWFFAGYTFDLMGGNLFSSKQELDFSIYSSQIGIDLFSRRTGSDYKLRNAKLGADIDASQLERVSFDGIKCVSTGVNVYYIFNHGRFSYPAAFAQSTCQKISCGSWLAGVGYTHNTLDLDYNKLQNLFGDQLGPQKVQLDSGLMFNSVRYHDFILSGGYAYNWVFAKNWLACASVQAALAYDKTISDMAAGSSTRVFDFENINLNGIGRFAVVFNNTRWYAGLSAIVRMNNYHKERFSTNNVYGYVNLYAGFNFGLKEQYRKEKKK